VPSCVILNYQDKCWSPDFPLFVPTYYKPHALQRRSSLADLRQRGVEVDSQLLQIGALPSEGVLLTTRDVRCRFSIVGEVGRDRDLTDRSRDGDG
jgi:hypothetical protein